MFRSLFLLGPFQIFLQGFFQEYVQGIQGKESLYGIYPKIPAYILAEIFADTPPEIAQRISSGAFQRFYQQFAQKFFKGFLQGQQRFYSLEIPCGSAPDIPTKIII